MGDSTVISIFDFLDYRAFLRDWYREAKSRYGFSYRVFSRQAGFKSANVLQRVMDGQRNLSPNSISKFIKALDLSKEEGEHFRNLVYFGQAKTHREKDRFYQKITSAQRYQKIHSVAVDQYAFYHTWYHSAVRELLVSPEYDGTEEWIAGRLDPNVPIQKIVESIKLLQRLGLIEKANGVDTHWRQTTPLLTSGAQPSAQVTLNYHEMILDLIRNRLPKTRQGDRDVSAMTLGIVRERLPQLQKMIQDFRRQVLQLASADEAPEEVVLLSMQLMPLTLLPEKRK